MIKPSNDYYYNDHYILRYFCFPNNLEITFMCVSYIDRSHVLRVKLCLLFLILFFCQWKKEICNRKMWYID